MWITRQILLSKMLIKFEQLAQETQGREKLSHAYVLIFLYELQVEKGAELDVGHPLCGCPTSNL